MSRITVTIAAIACCAAVYGTEQETDGIAAKTETETQMRCTAHYENGTFLNDGTHSDVALDQSGEAIMSMTTDCLERVAKEKHGSKITGYEIEWWIRPTFATRVSANRDGHIGQNIDIKAILATLKEQTPKAQAELVKIAEQEAKAAEAAKEQG